MTSWHWWQTIWQGRLWWTSSLQTRKNWLGIQARAALAAAIWSSESQEEGVRQIAVDLRRAGFGRFRDLLARIFGDTALERRGIPESWLIFFKDHLLPAQKWSILMCKKSNKGSRRSAWRTKMLLTKFKCKMKTQKKSKQDQVTQEHAGLSKHSGMGWEKPHSF